MHEEPKSAQIIPFETCLERALKKACAKLNAVHKHGLCDDELYFSVIEKLDIAIQRTKKA